MMRAAKVDGNQPAIVDALRLIEDCSVLVLSAVGSGCPDICVGYRGANFFFEIKDPEQPKHRHELTDDQRTFHEAWHGQVRKVFTLIEIIDHITGRYDERLCSIDLKVSGQASGVLDALHAYLGEKVKVSLVERQAELAKLEGGLAPEPV
jgi:hypothetical protein